MPHAIARDGVKIHYRVEPGDGPVVVLIQGLGLSSAFWGHFPEHIRSALPGARVILVDNRGVGDSDEPKGLFTVADLADDVRVVLDSEKIASAIVVGVSLGGMIAQEFALRHSNFTAGLVLISTTPGFDAKSLPKLEALALMLQAPRAMGIDARRELYRKLFFGTKPPHESARLAAELMERWAPLFQNRRLSVATFARQLLAGLRHRTSDRLQRIACPTHVLFGSDDIVIRPELTQALGRAIPGAVVEELAGGGHALPAEQPETIAHAIARTAAKAGLTAQADTEGIR
jgi:3-oxoadipate enol-lactonase